MDKSSRKTVNILLLVCASSEDLQENNDRSMTILIFNKNNFFYCLILLVYIYCPLLINASSRMLTPRKLLPNTDPLKYAQEGYCVFRQQFTGEEMKLHQQTLDGMLDCLRPGEKPQFMFEPHVGSQHWRTWLNLARHPTILDAVESVLGSDLILILSHFIIKGIEDKMEIGWHQDQWYWLHGVEGDRLCTVWLAFNKTDRQNGCMRVLPGTNQPTLLDVNVKEDDGSTITTLEVEVDKDLADTAVDIELQPGEFSLHNAYVIHGSDSNRSQDFRKIYTIRYADANTTRFTPEKWPIPFFLVRGEAPNPSFYIDLRPDKDLPADQPDCLLVRKHRAGTHGKIPVDY